MRPCDGRTSIVCALVIPFFFAVGAPAQELETDHASLPTVKFFYFDAAGVEWAVSAEPQRFEQHLASNSDSQRLFEAILGAIIESPENSDSSRQMTRWIESERERFEQSRREPARMRMAEGVIAYLRAYDFDIRKLVGALKRRSGASEVELTVVHLLDRQGNPSFKLKVVLVDPEIEIGKQGFNIDLPSPNANYVVVTYAMGVALYGVQEIIHRESSDETDENRPIELLPLPEPVEARLSATRGTRAAIVP